MIKNTIFDQAKLIVGIILFTTLWACKSDNLVPEAGRNTVVRIRPDLTDAGYSAIEKEHYVARNTKTHLNKLMLFIGGSYSNPADYHFICDHAATLGFDVISLSYPNDVAAAPLGTSSDKLIFDNYREELCFGTPVSSEVSVDLLNCIATRATKLLQYLSATYPDQNWAQYLTATNTLRWSSSIVSGHSQGSGHACYLGKKNLVERVVMFSGPNDYSSFFSEAANWLTLSGQTPLDRHFSLLHIQDEIVPFSYQVANLRALGVLSAEEDPTLVDNLAKPYSNARALSVNIPALSNHSAPVGGNSKLPEIWTYMFTAE